MDEMVDGLKLSSMDYILFVTSTLAHVWRTETIVHRPRLHWVNHNWLSHIPKKVYDNPQPVEQKPGQSHIPGYAGYVHSIKSENLYADTFGRITSNVNSYQYVKGQDVPPREKYVSTATKTNIPPSEMLRRTAAEVVGIPNKEIKIHEPRLGEPTGP